MMLLHVTPFLLLLPLFTPYRLCEYVTALTSPSQTPHSTAQFHEMAGLIFFICRVKGHFSSAEAELKSLHSIFINVTSQWPVTSLLLIAFSIVPFAETPTMWVSSIFGNEGGLAPST